MLINADTVCLIDCGQEKRAGKRYFISKESQHYLFIIANNRMLLRVNQKQYHMQPFTFMIIPFETRELILETRAKTAYRYLHISCTEAYLQKFSEHHLSYSEIYTLAQPLAVEEIWNLLQQFLHPLKIHHTPETAKYALHLLLCLFLEGSDGTVTRASEIPYYNKLTALRRKIYSSPSQSWYIQDICNSLGISRPYFHKIYLSAFGTTCTQDVIASRIACAKKLLETTDYAISVISQQCGFDTDVYFMRQFKRHVGMTPTTYRRIYGHSMT